MVNGAKIKRILGATIREFRLEKELSQDKLSEHIGVQPETISLIERGKSFVSCEVLEKLSNFFNVSPAVFFTPKVRVHTEERDECIKEIHEMLPVCDDKTLNDIRNILIVLQNK